ncbi:MAG: hypothetical protein IJP24_04100 [Firmicutes bacterium]|nr:hypothetical protein [Bacillota bacterium]
MKYLKLTGLFAALATICWAVLIFFEPMGGTAELTIAAIAFSITAICFLALTICKLIWKKASPYKVFAIIDIIMGGGVLGYAIYDIKTDTGWFAGLLGALLIMFVVPVFVALLIADVALWYRHRKKGKTEERTPQIEDEEVQNERRRD